jgi:sensor histidine kinase YesM
MTGTTEISLPTADVTKRERAKARLYVLLQLGGWGLFTGIQVWATVSFPDQEDRWPLATELAIIAAAGLTGILLTHLMRIPIHRLRWKDLGWRSLLPLMILMGILSSMVWNGFEVFWVHGILHLPWNSRFSAVAAIGFEVLQGAIIICAWLSLYFFYHLFDRLNQSEIERLRLTSIVKEAELRALKSQVNPHFIFNSLNSLRALIDEDPERARQAVTQLANLLRYSLRSGQLETVPFEDELGVVNDYLALEQVRHEERLRLRLDIAPEALKLPIPPMLLQTLVENAVKYGISNRPEGGEISIVAREFGGELRIQVSNPGQISEGNKASTGVGLRNAADRLRIIFGERATLRLRAEKPESVVAEARIPLPT